VPGRSYCPALAVVCEYAAGCHLKVLCHWFRVFRLWSTDRQIGTSSSSPTYRTSSSVVVAIMATISNHSTFVVATPTGFQRLLLLCRASIDHREEHTSTIRHVRPAPNRALTKVALVNHAKSCTGRNTTRSSHNRRQHDGNNSTAATTARRQQQHDGRPATPRQA
jgi:hypothetical protein